MAYVQPGYEISECGIVLELKEYKTDKSGDITGAWCNCGGCGTVTPSLEAYTSQNLRKWLVEKHVKLFPREHGLKGGADLSIVFGR